MNGNDVGLQLGNTSTNFLDTKKNLFNVGFVHHRVRPLILNKKCICVLYQQTLFFFYMRKVP